MTYILKGLGELFNPKKIYELVQCQGYRNRRTGIVNTDRNKVHSRYNSKHFDKEWPNILDYHYTGQKNIIDNYINKDFHKLKPYFCLSFLEE